MANNILVVDTSHLLYRAFYSVIGNRTTLSSRQQQIAINRATQEIKDYQKRFKPDVVVAAFDGERSWRAQYAKKHRLKTYRISRNKYKTQREQQIKQSFNLFREQYKNLLQSAPGITAIYDHRLEADDIIAGIVENKKVDDIVNIMTLDHDTAFLMLNDNVRVYNMKNRKRFSKNALRKRRLERLLRGRHSYNVLSVFTRLPRTIFEQIANGVMSMQDAYDVLRPNQDSNMSARLRLKHNTVLLDPLKSPKRIKRRVKKALKDAFAINR